MKHQEKTPEGNLTKLMEFVLLDFADIPHLQGFLFGLFLLIYNYLEGQWHHISDNKTRPWSPDPHVYFPWQFFCFGNLLCVCYAPQNAHMSLDTKKNDFFSCLCHTNVLHSYTWGPPSASFWP